MSDHGSMSPRLDVPIRRPDVTRVARAAYAALAAVDATLAGLGGRAQEARVVTKTALMPTLALTAPPQPGLLTGLGLSWLGDVALLGRAPVRVAAGAGSFAAAHVAYLAGMGAARRLHRIDEWPTSARLFGLAALAVTPWAVRGAARESPALGVVVGGYAVVVTSLVAGSGLTGHPATQRGGLLFGVSDALLGLRMFTPAGTGPHGRLLDAAVMLTYTGAQYALVRGAQISGARGEGAPGAAR